MLDALYLLTGERGAGKTRMLIYASEFAARIAPNVRILYAACREGGDGAYAPLARLLLDRFGVTPSSAPSIVRGQMATVVGEALGQARGNALTGVVRLRDAATGTFANNLVLSGGTLAAGGWISSFLYGVNSRDALTLLSVTLLLGLGGLVAGWIPAVRASRVNPVKVLRLD